MAGNLGQDLRTARKRTGLTFEVFAKQAGFSAAHLRNVENGTRNATPDVANAYDRVCRTGGAFAAELSGYNKAETPWNRQGTLAALTELTAGGGVDRRAFVVTSGAALAALLGHWRTALASPEPIADEHEIAYAMGPGTTALLDSVDTRLKWYAHQGDEKGSRRMAALARNELALVADLIKGGGMSGATSQRAYSLACEASRQAAWNLFDASRYPAAQRYFNLALRTSATAHDSVSGAYAASLMAVQHYTAGEPRNAVSILESAADAVSATATPRLRAMLAARRARAISKTGDRRGCIRALGEAREWWSQGTRDDDDHRLYWVTEAELEMIAGSSALQLGDHSWALHSFNRALDAVKVEAAAHHPGDENDGLMARWHAIYLTRTAEAYVGLRDLDAAVETGQRAAACLGKVDSARSLKELAGLHTQLEPHRANPAVREFLSAG